MELIFNAKKFEVICFTRECKTLITVDAEFGSEIDSFICFIENHSFGKGKFDFRINGNDYIGWFGAYNFDKTGKVRFYLAVYDEKEDYSGGRISNDNIKKSIEFNRALLKEIALKVIGEERVTELFTKEVEYRINYPHFYTDDLEKEILNSGETPFGKLK